MFSYRLMKMQMNKLLNNKKHMTVDEVMNSPNGASDGSGNYMNSPRSMSMNMHMFGVMYAPSERLTLMVMNNYSKKEMKLKRMRMSGGKDFNVNSSGFGDLDFSAIIKINDGDLWKNNIVFGTSLPTGSIDIRDKTPVSSSSRLGYNMQNGTGTYDPFIIINNTNIFENLRFGEQLFFKIPASGKNSKGYSYGKNLKLNLWSSYRFMDELSGSLKFTYDYMGKMIGSDNEMNKRMSPTLDSNNQGFQKMTLGFGINFINHKEFLENNRLALEFLIPVFKKYRGIQMHEDFKLILGWQYAF